MSSVATTLVQGILNLCYILVFGGSHTIQQPAIDLTRLVGIFLLSLLFKKEGGDGVPQSSVDDEDGVYLVMNLSRGSTTNQN